MQASLNNFLRRSEGVAAVELALALPIVMMLIVGTVEVGRAMYQAGALERGIRAGAMYAAHHDFPLSQAIIDEVENIVKTGQAQSGGTYLMSGWSNAAATVDIQPLSYDLNGTPIPVIKVSASVPFDPLLPGLTGIMDLGSFTFNLSHEQAFVGD